MIQANKPTKLLSEYIAKVAQGKHAMVMGVDYVVMSRPMYDEMMAKYEKYEGGNPLDCFDDLINLDAKQDLRYDEEKEIQRIFDRKSR